MVNDSLWLMFMSTGGFGWVTAGSEAAPPRTVEWQISVTMTTPAAVDEFIGVAREAGARILSERQQQALGLLRRVRRP